MSGMGLFGLFFVTALLGWVAGFAVGYRRRWPTTRGTSDERRK